MKKRIILIAVVLVAAGVAAVYAFRGCGRRPSNRMHRSPAIIELTEVNIAFKTAGRLIERTVDEGDAVKKGQVIARLDRDQLLRQRAREGAPRLRRGAAGAGRDVGGVAEGDPGGDVEQRRPTWRRTKPNCSS